LAPRRRGIRQCHHAPAVRWGFPNAYVRIDRRARLPRSSSRTIHWQPGLLLASTDMRCATRHHKGGIASTLVLLISVGLVGVGVTCLSVGPSWCASQYAPCCIGQEGTAAECVGGSDCGSDHSAVSRPLALLSSSACGVEADALVPPLGAAGRPAPLNPEDLARGRRFLGPFRQETVFSPPVSLHLLYEVLLN